MKTYMWVSESYYLSNMPYWLFIYLFVGIHHASCFYICLVTFASLFTCNICHVASRGCDMHKGSVTKPLTFLTKTPPSFRTGTHEGRVDCGRILLRVQLERWATKCEVGEDTIAMGSFWHLCIPTFPHSIMGMLKICLDLALISFTRCNQQTSRKHSTHVTEGNIQICHFRRFIDFPVARVFSYCSLILIFWCRPFMTFSMLSKLQS